MNRSVLKAVSLLALAVTLAAAPVNTEAQSNNAMVITIPFSFTAGSETLPAGEYTVRRASQTSGAYLIQSADKKSTATVLTAGSLTDGRGRAAARLEFKSYGGEHFLAQVWMPWSTVGSAVRVSGAKERLARRGGADEMVTVVARQR